MRIVRPPTIRQRLAALEPVTVILRLTLEGFDVPFSGVAFGIRGPGATSRRRCRASKRCAIGAASFSLRDVTTVVPAWFRPLRTGAQLPLNPKMTLRCSIFQ